MIRREDVQKLAELSLLRVDDAEVDRFTGEIDAILAYVSELGELALEEDVAQVPDLRNVMRDDVDPHEPGMYTERLLNETPRRHGDWLRVKKIL